MVRTDDDNKRLRLLVIDDEPIVGRRLQQVFTKMGFDVETYTNPVAAMETMDRHPFDIVVTDLKMEGLDGMAVLERVKKKNPDTKVVIITGYAQLDTASEAFRRGVFDFIAKPFRLDELKRVIIRAMEDARLSKEERS
ncbi:MAG: response regulator [Dissulfurimicrobium sp.]|uniref:response regulator n=1 Tax=Dissulfurimicrobium TaxID=1769732 RepID=UPI001EDAF954|nr:response regulator [Dissulfurimicrobium hydrothermale]UKL13548.1 response regulator [Dissulfurimicrobium hydrothermale]